MAKRKTEVEEVTTSATVEEVEEIEPLQEEPKTVESLEKTYTITPKFSGRKFVAGRWYEFEKDVPIEVHIGAKKALKMVGQIYL